MTTLDDTNVFVKYLPSALDDQGLAELFAPCGTIKSAKVMVDHQTGLSLGFGYAKKMMTNICVCMKSKRKKRKIKRKRNQEQRWTKRNAEYWVCLRIHT